MVIQIFLYTYIKPHIQILFFIYILFSFRAIDNGTANTYVLTTQTVITLYYISFLKNTNIPPPPHRKTNKISCSCYVPLDSKSNMAHRSKCFPLQNLLCIGFPGSSLATSLVWQERPFKGSKASLKVQY